MPLSETVNKIRLAQARNTNNQFNQPKNKGGGIFENAKNLAESANPSNLISLTSNINFAIDWLVLFAVLVAIIKDLLDFIVVLTVISGIVVNVFVFIVFLLISPSPSKTYSSQKRTRGIVKSIARQGGKRMAVMGAGTVFEIIPGLGMLPVETIIVIILYILVLAERNSNKNTN